MMAIRLHTGRVIADTRIPYENPSLPAFAWEDTGTVTVRVDYIIGVTDAQGPSMEKLDPRPAAVCVRDMGNLVVREPITAIEIAMVRAQPGIWQWSEGAWQLG